MKLCAGNYYQKKGEDQGMKKVFVIYQHRNNQKHVFGYTSEEKLATSELIRLTEFSAENKFSMEYNFIPFNGRLLRR